MLKKIYQELVGLAENLTIQNKTQNGYYDRAIGYFVGAKTIDSLFRCSIDDKETLNAYIKKLKRERSY